MPTAANKISGFDKPILREFRKEIEQALAGLAEQRGVQFQVGGASFDTSNVRFTLEAAVIGEDGQAETRERGDFKRHAWQFGLKPGDLDRVITWQGRRGVDQYRLIGLRMRAPKFPILAVRLSDSKEVCLPKAAVASITTPPTGPMGSRPWGG